MTKLKMMAAIGVSALTLSGAIAGGAAAQPYRNYDRGHDYNQGSYSNLSTSYVDGLEWKINNAAQQRVISNGERRALLSELRQIQPLAFKVQTGRASRGEVNRLQAGVNRIESATTRYASNGRNPRYGDYDRRY